MCQNMQKKVVTYIHLTTYYVVRYVAIRSRPARRRVRSRQRPASSSVLPRMVSPSAAPRPFRISGGRAASCLLPARRSLLRLLRAAGGLLLVHFKNPEIVLGRTEF